MHHFRYGKTACQSRAFDAQEIDPAFVSLFLPDDEVLEALVRCRRRALWGKLGPYAGVIGHQGIGIHSRKILLNLGNGLIQPRGVDGEVIRIVHPLDVRAEADPSGHVKGEMGAETTRAWLGGWVYKAGDFGAGGRVGEIVALCVKELLVLRGGHNHVVDGDGAEAGGVDDRLGGDGGDVAAGAVRDVDFPARAAGGGSSRG